MDNISKTRSDSESEPDESKVGNKSCSRTAGRGHNSTSSKVSNLEKKFDLLLEKLSRNNAVSPRRRPAMIVSSDDEDIISLQPGQTETLTSEDEPGMPCLDPQLSSDFSKSTNKGLFDLFGKDALTKASEDNTQGITLDSCQREVLLQSWRAANPSNVSAFSEENFDTFTVSKETQEFLKVPSLDELVESCLVKKFGNKAAFTKSGAFLFSQPFKMLEKMAFRGQQSAYLGIVIQLYLQQNLASLLEIVQDKEELDKADIVSRIKDIFAMSTKGLDQLGRTGAFHHMTRRTVAMSDTSLFQLHNARTISNLPLTADGVFGVDLEKTLKDRKEKLKSVADILPFSAKKRRAPMEESHSSKRPRISGQNNINSNFSKNYNRNNDSFRSYERNSRRYGHRTDGQSGGFRKPSATVTSNSQGTGKKSTFPRQ
ncbi:hypothetical protein SNE40_011946 [Patella caerulea]|uniref:Uncharacterized protein n=1 Tax=Patella caerulea TaxID=87958 RepID=A0AAN8JMH8_PATCE